MKILIVKPSSLGDIIHALRVTSVISKNIEGVRIDWVIKKGLEDIIKSTGIINKYFVFDRGKGLVKYIQLGLKLRRQNYDLVFDMQGLLRSAFLGKLTKGKEFYGCADGREFSTLFYKPIGEASRKGEIHAIEKLLPFLDCLNLQKSNALRVEFKNAKKHHKEDFIKGNKKKNIFIFPESRRKEKIWPYFDLLVKKITKDYDVNVVICGSYAGSNSQSHYDLRGKVNLEELPSLIKLANVVITNDSAPLHIASALGIPILAFFGPTKRTVYGPYPNDQISIAIQSKTENISDISTKEVICGFSEIMRKLD